MRNKKTESDAILKRKKHILAIIAFLRIFLCSFSVCLSKDEVKNIRHTQKSSVPVSTSEKTSEVTTVKNSTTASTTGIITTVSKTETEKETEATAGTVTETETITKTSASTTETESESESSEKVEKTNKFYSDNFFDDAVFVGDSVTMGLRNFVTSERNKGHECLGKAKFLAEGSMGYSNTLPKIGTNDSIHPKYQGKEMYIEDALALLKAKKVFIMLGMNDFCIYPVNTGIGNAEKLINRIKEKNPGIDVYIESVTPALRNLGNFSNENIDKFNAGLKEFCKENNCTYVDIASVMKDSDGNFIRSYCSDPDGKGVHMTYEGCKAWVNYLNTNYGKEKWK